MPTTALRRATAAAALVMLAAMLPACARGKSHRAASTASTAPTTTRRAAASPVAISPLTLTPEGAEIQFLAALNHRRRVLGLPALAPEPRMVPVAREWAAHMADAGGISHNPDLGSRVPDDWRKYGENVGVGETVASLHEAFLASPKHYVNIVDPVFTSVGVGVVIRGPLIWVVFDFLAAGPPPPPAG